MSFVLALTHQTGRRLAEIGFLLILFAGIWLAAAQIPQVKMGTARTIIAGIALAIGGLLLIIATHSGHFGQARGVPFRRPRCRNALRAVVPGHGEQTSALDETESSDPEACPVSADALASTRGGSATRLFLL